MNTRTLALLLLLLLSVMILCLRFISSPGFLSNVSAVETSGNIGIYWDKNCSYSTLSIDWGTLPPGGHKEFVVYVRNEANESRFLIISTANWTPVSANQYLSFSWNCTSTRINASEVVPVTERLMVSIDIREITNFSFDIVFIGRKYPVGDVDLDYTVGARDFYYLARLFGLDSTHPLWNANADFNVDNKIDMKDFHLLAKNYGQDFSP